MTSQKLRSIRTCNGEYRFRSVDDLVKALGWDGISKSQVSRLCEVASALIASLRAGNSRAREPLGGVSMRFFECSMICCIPVTAVACGRPAEARLLAAE
ncbi:MAG: hypothetical protein ABW039_03980 [Sphingobium sp.]